MAVEGFTDVATTKDVAATRDMAVTQTVEPVTTVASTTGVTKNFPTQAASAEPTPKSTRQLLPSLTQWVEAQTVAFGWDYGLG